LQSKLSFRRLSRNPDGAPPSWLANGYGADLFDGCETTLE
jgi:hypothetical protein